MAMYVEAFLAGFWASIGSLMGKLSGTTSYIGGSYLLWALVILGMLAANSWGCRLYLRSLDAASNSAAPTVISAASAYLISGILGITLFEEKPAIYWWMGAFIIIMGLGLITRPRKRAK